MTGMKANSKSLLESWSEENGDVEVKPIRRNESVEIRKIKNGFIARRTWDEMNHNTESEGGKCCGSWEWRTEEEYFEKDPLEKKEE